MNHFGGAFQLAGQRMCLQAIDLLNQAVARDPSFFEAYCLARRRS